MPTIKASMGLDWLAYEHRRKNHWCNHGIVQSESGVLCLEQFERLIECLIALVRLGIVFIDVIVLVLTDEDVRCDRFILDLLAVRALVFRNSEEEGCAIRKFDGLLDGTFAEGAFADYIATLCAFDSISRQLSSAVGSAIDEHCDRSACKVLR